MVNSNNTIIVTIHNSSNITVITVVLLTMAPIVAPSAGAAVAIPLRERPREITNTVLRRPKVASVAAASPMKLAEEECGETTKIIAPAPRAAAVLTENPVPPIRTERTMDTGLPGLLRRITTTVLRRAVRPPQILRPLLNHIISLRNRIIIITITHPLHHPLNNNNNSNKNINNNSHKRSI